MVKPAKIWRFLPFEAELCGKLSRELGVSPVVAQVLINRGICDKTSAEQYLYGGVEALVNPMHLAGVERAVSRLARSINEKEKITIYGDYDVDGITATALLYLVLKQAGAMVEYYIPERQSEGYGLNDAALAVLADSGTKVIITVDCGISGVAEVAKFAGIMDIIITDHHQPPPDLPPAYAIVNPKVAECSYPYKQLAGVGVAFKVCQALWEKLGLDSAELAAYLDLVAIGTIADIVPLTGENRALVRLGLARLAETDNIGLKALMTVTGLSGENIDAGKVGFVIGPRLNAAGRLSQATAGVELLVTNDARRADELANELNNENIRRQKIEKDVLAEAEELLGACDRPDCKVLVLAKEDWHPGVIGIVASRLVERYYRPVVMISIRDGVGKGSCRSIPGFDVHRALECCSSLLIQYGGHQQAAGLSIDPANIGKLREALNNLAVNWLTEEDYRPLLKIEAKISLAEINDSFLEQLSCLAPHGSGNPAPVFACENLAVTNIRPLGKDGRHFKLRVRQRGTAGDIMAWNMAAAADRVEDKSNIDVAFVPEFNSWQGRRSIQLRAYDLKEREIFPAGLAIADNRGTEDKAGYVAKLAQNGKVLVHVNDRKAAVLLSAALRRLLSGRVAVVYRTMGGKRRQQALANWLNGRAAVLVSACCLVEREDYAEHIVLFEPPLSREVFVRQCNEAILATPVKLHFVYSPVEVKLAGKGLEEGYPDRLLAGKLYLALKSAAGSAGKYKGSNTALARMIMRDYGARISCEGIDRALVILSELALVELAAVKNGRIVRMKPEPAEKLDIGRSAAYLRYAGVREAFNRWAMELFKENMAEIWQKAVGSV